MPPRSRVLALLLACSLTLSVNLASTPTVRAATTLTVTTTADNLAPCAALSFSLRCALSQANVDSSGDTIAFNIPASDRGCTSTVIQQKTVVVCTIAPVSALPMLTASNTTINGYSQPGAVANTHPFQAGDNAIPTVVLDGANAGVGVDGLSVSGTHDTIKGLSITGFITSYSPTLGQFGGNGITLNGKANTVQGNFLGVKPDGVTGRPNQFIGVSAQGAGGHTIGGSASAAFNVLSGNGLCTGDCSGFGVYVWSGTATRIVNNYIGTTASGRAKLANMATGMVLLANNTTVVNNVISGNGGDGVLIGSSGNVMTSNRIGTDVTGSARLRNHNHGLEVQGPNNTIGGTTAGGGNVISANGDTGLVLTTTGNVIQGNRIGTNAAGTAALGNGFFPTGNLFGQLINGTDGIVVCVGPNTIGGTAAGAGNLISGNAGDGVALVSDGNTVQGNKVGTDAAGLVALGNGVDGIGTLAVPLKGAGFCQQAPQTGGNNNVIGGAAAGAGNLVSGNKGQGIDIVLGSGNLIAGNRIGTTGAASAILPNLGDGVLVSGQCNGSTCAASSNNTIGGTATGAGNVIGGNAGDGVHLDGAGNGQGNLVQGNQIGVGAANASIGNGANGVFVGNSAVNDSIGGTATGAGNVIANNALSGVLVGSGASDATTHSAVQRNAIHNNGGLGIDLAPQGTVNCATPPPGPNNYTPCPLVFPITTPSVNGTACVGCTVEVYIASDEADDQGHGEGSALLGVAVADGAGNWTIPLAPGQLSAGQKVTASATTAATFGVPAQTSEFAANAIVGP